jgi:hypothetical protein
MSKSKSKNEETAADHGEVSFKLVEMFERFTEKILTQMNANQTNQINQINLNFQKHTELLQNEIFSLTQRLDLAENENKKLKNDVVELNNKNSALANLCNKLEQKIDQIEAKENINDVTFNGEFQIEPKRDKVVSFINSSLPSAKITEANILDFHLAKKENKSFLKIKLDSNATKAKLFQAHKQSAPKNIYLSECLTQRQYKLLQEAKGIAKLGHIKFVWSRNGSVFVRQTENSKPVQIYQNSDLQKFITQ